MTRRPATNQREFKFDRAKQLKLRSAVKLPPAEKFILWIIDDHIGGKRSWTLTYGKIAEESGYTERCVRKAVAALDEHLIVWTKRASNHYHDQRREYFIDWQNLEELVDEQSKANKEPTDEPPLDPEPRSEIVNDDPQSGTSFANRERSSAIVNVVPDSIYTKTAPLTAPTTAHSPPPSPPSAPPPAVDEFADQKTAVVVMVKECGVGQFVKAVDNALAAGMTLEQIRQVCGVFESHPRRWTAAQLFERLTRSGASLLGPSEGWFGDSAEWTASEARRKAAQEARERKESEEMTAAATKNQTQDPRELKYGAELDGMTAEQLAELLGPSLGHIVQAAKRYGKDSPLVRPLLLSSLEDRDIEARAREQQREATQYEANQLLALT